VVRRVAHGPLEGGVVILLKVLRCHKGLTQPQLSRLTRGRVSQPEISNLERGLHPRPDQVKALGAAFGMSADDAAWLFKPIETLGLDPKFSIPEPTAPPPPSLAEAVRKARQ
jgi:transcriptional regulator with XRE-family HTH domain